MKKNLCFFLEETPLRNYRFLEAVLFSRALGIYKRADNLCATRPYFHIVYHMSARIPYPETKKGAEKPPGVTCQTNFHPSSSKDGTYLFQMP